MDTPLPFMSSDQTKGQETMTKTAGFGPELTKPEPNKNRGRRASKGRGPKKQPQRGVGVAQLERLRLLDRLNKMTEIPPLTQQHEPDELHQYNTTPMLPFTSIRDPFASVPVQCGAANHGLSHFSQPVINGSSVGLLGQMIGHRGGFNGVNGGGSCSAIGGLLVSTNQVQMVEPYGVGAQGSRVLIETSKELSSMPNLHCVSADRCNVCFKKKRLNVEIVKESYGGRNQPSENLFLKGSDFLGFTLPQVPNFTAQANDFTARASSYRACNPDHETVEVVAVHRKGNSEGGRVFMEYEFFPSAVAEKNDRVTSTCSKELEILPTEGSVAVSTGEGSYITPTTYGDSSSNSVDLSLKLSY
ncbi:protein SPOROCYTELESS-like isoform X1 [Quillaja saponaria]|uniref:Protein SPOROCYTELESS-like isoform X1 n=1 Tax=Quillaja saponaria TaxID=32244 RepID=A0AAD7KZ17_QUISA|nr:protein SPOROCYTELESS-like isoform X1 [Quillaja saponaria]